MPDPDAPGGSDPRQQQDRRRPPPPPPVRHRTNTSSAPGPASGNPSSWMTADPSQWPNLFRQYAARGQGLTKEEAQLIADELSAANERKREGQNPYGGGYLSGLSGFKFPANVSPDELSRVLSQAEQWAASVGWQYMPSAASIMALMGRGALTQQDIGAYFYSRLPASAQKAMPWAQYGLDKTGYTSSLRGYNEMASQLLGTDYSSSGLDQGLLQQAFAGSWSASRLQEAITNDPTARGKYGWIKHGMNYNDFQRYLTDNKSSLEKRFGLGQASSTNALSDLDNPLVGFGSSAGAISFDSQRSPLMSTSQSSVR